MTTVSVQETDYLDEDKPLRGQNYACLSFLSPEDVLQDKEVYIFRHFVGSFAAELDVLMNGLKTKFPTEADSIDTIRENHAYLFDADEMQEQYKFYKNVHGQDLDKRFQEKNDFRTSVRGIKVRGVFDTLKEAQVRADVLKRMGDKFDIFVAQVGCWCPWSPNPQDLEDQQYSETQLNTLMSKYKENMDARDEFYHQRKDEKIQKARDAVAAAKKAAEAASTSLEPAEPAEPAEPVESTTEPVEPAEPTTEPVEPVEVTDTTPEPTKTEE
jgi:hypothetical protein